MSEPTPRSLPLADVALDRDVFLRTLLRHLAGTLQDVVGLQAAEGFVSIVGQRIGDEIDSTYRSALAVERLSRAQVVDVLIDLKARIQGDFYVIEQDDQKIVLGNRRCPFGDKVRERPSLCMMTSNVFGAIVAENLGYAKVAIEAAIARGDAQCRIVVYLRPDDDARGARGREYLQR